MIRCTFAGHRDVCGVQAEDITEVLEEIIQYTESPIECFVGGMGKFDNLCAAAVRLLKRQYREKEISLILVLPYLQKRINVNSAYYESMFDLVLIPSILEGVHYKHAIVLRNRWMVEQADYVIAMVERKEGGAYATLQYAKKKKKKMKSYKPYCNTPEIHLGNLILAKKKSSKSANASDTLSPIGKLLA